MRHRRLRRKLGVKSDHRKALLRNLLRALVLKKRIETTHAKAKETSAFADKMVTIAKKDGLHARRLLISKLGNADVADLLIKKIAPQFKDRQGGYTRVLRLGLRPGDGAQKALLEWTAVFEAPAKKAKKKKEKKPEEKVDDKPSLKETAKTVTEKKKEAETPKPVEKPDSEKRGGFLGKLRKFLKGDDQ
ncbi:MAG TPA: 50S ribosomal protein L17 [Candidatus Omnitrophota bacterium]|nr:50S ribosomal protein L17 [Candidatus Omnitrophota bacterium]